MNVGRCSKMINNHHIDYEKNWTVELNGQWHRSITILQRMNATPENYAKAINLLHSVTHEANRIRMELDITEGNDD